MAILIGNIRYTYIPHLLLCEGGTWRWQSIIAKLRIWGGRLFSDYAGGKGIVHVWITRRERGWKDVEELTMVLEEDADVCRLTITQTFGKEKRQIRIK